MDGHGFPPPYRVVQKIRISYIDPIIDLTAPSLGPASREYLILIDRSAAKHLNNQFLRVICADGTVKEHRLVDNGYGCKLKVGSTPAISRGCPSGMFLFPTAGGR